MIRIRTFSSYHPNSDAANECFIRVNNLTNDPDYGTKYIFTDDDTYTHAFLLNTPQPKLHIPKENVYGFAFEPPKFLGLTHSFVQYACNNIGTYFIGEQHNLPSPPFTEHFGYMFHTEPAYNLPKPKLMSIMISQKTDLQIFTTLKL